MGGYPILVQCIEVLTACLRTIAWSRCALAVLDLSERPNAKEVETLIALTPHVPLSNEVGGSLSFFTDFIFCN